MSGGENLVFLELGYQVQHEEEIALEVVDEGRDLLTQMGQIRVLDIRNQRNFRLCFQLRERFEALLIVLTQLQLNLYLLSLLEVFDYLRCLLFLHVVYLHQEFQHRFEVEVVEYLLAVFVHEMQNQLLYMSIVF